MHTHPPIAPQVILLGADSPIGLSIVRELGRHGVRVHGIGRTRASIALYSRHVHSRHRRPAGDAPLRALLLDLHRETGCTAIMTVAESDIVWLQAERARLAPLVPLVPDAGAMARVLDKAQTLRAAEALGIQTPQTWLWPDLTAMERDLPDLTFPAVLKWSHPARVGGALARLGLPREKLRYVHTAVELRQWMTSYAPVGELPLVQRHYPGQGLGQMLLLHNGEPVLRFQHLRLAEWPPEGGFSVVCESLAANANADLFAKSIALLRALGLDGPAMVEYRYDPRTGQAVLMEVNGRFWGSLPLAYHAGAPFAWTTFALGALGHGPTPQAPYRVGMRCRFLLPELKRLLRITFQRQLVPDRTLRFHLMREWLGFFGGFLRPGTRYFVFALDDPLPFFADLWFNLLARIPGPRARPDRVRRRRLR